MWYEMGLPVSEVLEDVSAEDSDSFGVVNRIYVKDESLQTLFYGQVADFGGSSMIGFCAEGQSNPVLVAEDTEGIYLQEMDLDNRKLTEKVRLSQDLALTVESEILAVQEDGFLFRQGSDLYRYDAVSQTCDKVLNFASVGIYASELLYFGAQGEEIQVVEAGIDEGEAAYCVLAEGENQRTRLELGLMTLEDAPALEKMIIAYNRSQEKVFIDVVSYYDESGTYEDGVEQLKLDIIRGEAPDILEVSALDVSMLSGKGVLADLYGFLEADNQCGVDQLVPSVLECYENGGHLYSVAPAFQLYSMWGSRDVLGEKQGVTLTGLMGILKGLGKDINAVYGFSADEPVLTTLCTFAMDEFVDWEKGECDFTGEYFRELLAFAKEYDSDLGGESLSQNIRGGDIILSVGVISSVADYQVQSELYGGSLAFTGYPTTQGSGTALSFRGMELAVNARKENQEAAWEFVKYCLLNGYDGRGFPVVKAQFEAAMDAAMQPEMVETVEGTFEAAKSYYADEDMSFAVYEASQEDVEAVKQLVYSAGNRYEYSVEILNIILEEAESYFSGQKSDEEAAGIIQNRVRLYLQENR